MSPILMIFILVAVVALGGWFVSSLNANNKHHFIKLALAFSGGFLLAIIFEHLLPELYESSRNSIGVYILIGFLIQLILEYFSGGIEHGHVHVHKGQSMPWALFLSLSIHSVIEGIPIGNQVDLPNHVHEHHHSFSLFWGIVFHQIPVSIALMTLLLNSSMVRWKSWMVLMLFSIMTPIGLLIGLKIPLSSIGLSISMILGVVIGMFLHISTTIIFETAENHKFNFLKLSSIIIGVLTAIMMY